MDSELMETAPEGRKTSSDDPADYLAPTWFMDFENPLVRKFAEEVTAGARTDKEKAVRLFYAVRDKIRYDPYQTKLNADAYKASVSIREGVGWCVPKGIVMAALCRAVGIPARPGYADVRNHLCTPRMREMMGTDIFSYHGYVEIYLDGKWVKATPVFNVELCEKFGVIAQEFDGEHDTLLQPYDHSGNRHMEYLKDRGTYDDLPFREVMDDFYERYPAFMAMLESEQGDRGDFQKEAEAEGKSV